MPLSLSHIVPSVGCNTSIRSIPELSLLPYFVCDRPAKRSNVPKPSLKIGSRDKKFTFDVVASDSLIEYPDCSMVYKKVQLSGM